MIIIIYNNRFQWKGAFGLRLDQEKPVSDADLQIGAR